MNQSILKFLTKKEPETTNNKKGNPVGTELVVGNKGTEVGGNRDIPLLSTNQQGNKQQATSKEPKSNSYKEQGFRDGKGQFWYGKGQLLTENTRQQQHTVVGVQQLDSGTELRENRFTDSLECSQTECTE